MPPIRSARSRRLAAPALLALFLVVLGTLVVPDDSAAIPAFARRYDVSCTLCHAPVPRLKAFGEEFAARGFRMEEPGEPASAPAEGEEPPPPPRGTKPTGDPLLLLLDTLPLAVRAEGHAAWREEAEADTDFETPYVVKLLSGGPLSSKISYYAYFILEEGEVTGLEDAYLHFSKLFGTGIDLLAGQFQVSDPLFKREVRLTRADYEIYRVRVGEARANLTYDRGIVLTGTAPGEVDVVFQLVNGNGIPEGEFDADSNKNFALRLAREFGPVRVGLFGYLGEEDGPIAGSNEIVYWGPDLSISPSGDWQLNLQYLERTDDDPWFENVPNPDVDTRGGFAELVWLPQGLDGRWSVTALYNRVDSDDPAAEREDVALGVGWLAARNVRLVTEAGRDLLVEANRASFGVVTAF